MSQAGKLRRRPVRHSLAMVILLHAICWPVGASDDVGKAGEAQWHRFRGDAAASGVARGPLADQPQLVWKYTVDKGAFEVTPIVVDGVCYLADLDGNLHALQLDDGKTLWTKKTGAFGFAASPLFHKGRLLVGDIDGIFYCFNLQGEKQWQYTPEDGGVEISASASIYQGNVLYGSQDAKLYCLNADDGKLNWTVEVQDQIRCSPTVAGDRCFVAGCDGQLHIVDLKQGKEAGAVAIDAPTGVSPAVLDDSVVFGTEAGEVFRVQWQTGKVVWRFAERRRREIRSSAAVSPQMVVVGSRSKKVYGIHPQTGKQIWEFPCRRSVESSPVIIGKRVFVASTDGRLYLLDLMTGKQLWKHETGDSFSAGAAIVAGKIVIASDDGVVYCFGQRKDT